jgi:hypothetical protein
MPYGKSFYLETPPVLDVARQACYVSELDSSDGGRRVSRFEAQLFSTSQISMR